MQDIRQHGTCLHKLSGFNAFHRDKNGFCKVMSLRTISVKDSMPYTDAGKAYLCRSSPLRLQEDSGVLKMLPEITLNMNELENPMSETIREQAIV